MVEDSLLHLPDWLSGKEGQELLSNTSSTEGVREVALNYLLQRSPPGSLANVSATGETGLTGLTYLTVVLEEQGATREELALMTVEQKRTTVNHLLASTHGIYLSELESMTTFQVASLTCHLPRINSVDVLTDVARLSEDNEFCLAGSECSNTFSAFFKSNLVEVSPVSPASVMTNNVPCRLVATCRPATMCSGSVSATSQGRESLCPPRSLWLVNTHSLSSSWTAASKEKSSTNTRALT